ncbi:hypothetical protein BGZ81_006962 [Podila clonocystis]|nr:hypothetical protein BGZ81_006962 [Podila clonocystis]
MPTKRTCAAAAKEQLDCEVRLNQLYEKIESIKWEEVINGIPFVAKLLNHAEKDNMATEKALCTILAILSPEQSHRASHDPETWIYLREMVIDILQVYTSSVDELAHWITS